MKCDICGEVNDAVEIHMCKQCANKFSDNVNRIKRDLAIYKRALELACKDNKRAYDLQYLESDVLISNVEAFVGEYLRKAKEEFEEQDGNK